MSAPRKEALIYSGKVKALFRAISKGTREEIKEITISVEGGFSGDVHTKKHKRQLAIFSEQARLELAAMIGKGEKGLCFERFKENILLAGNIPSNRTPGMLIKIGETGLRISEHGKKCYAECEFIKAKLQVKEYCPLQREVIFADCIQEGVVRVDDPVIIVE